MARSTEAPVPAKKAQKSKSGTPAEQAGAALERGWSGLEEFWRGRPRPDAIIHDWMEMLDRAGGMMRIETSTEAGQMVVRAELPGVDPDKDVTVSLEGDLLTIHAVRRDERQEQVKGSRRVTEFRYGESVRTVRVPTGADPDAVSASYEDGILEVRLPIPRSSDKPHRIAVTRDGGN